MVFMEVNLLSGFMVFLEVIFLSEIVKKVEYDYGKFNFYLDFVNEI